MNKISIFLGLAVLAIAVASIIPQAALAYRGDPTVKGPNYTEERHEAMEKAFETSDFNAWKTLMEGRGRVTEVVNAENFAKFAEAHELSEQGKITEAKAIRAELGLGLRNGLRAGQGMGQGCTNR